MPDDKNPFEDVNRLSQIIHDLDERGLVLTLSAFAEEALGELLAAFMRTGNAADALLTGFNAPLGTFSARIKASFALGLITDRQHENFDRLRKIRNEFAHSWEPIKFSDRAVAAHISALNFIPLTSTYPATQIEKVRTCISAALIEIRSTTSQIQKNGTGARSIGSHLIPGHSPDVIDRIAACETKLSEIGNELPSTIGERHKFLLAQRERWLSLLTIIWQGASDEDRWAIARLLKTHAQEYAISDHILQP